LCALVLGCASSGVGRARSLVAEDKGAEALPILEALAVQNPNNGEVLDLLGQAYYRTGRHQDAETKLTNAQSLGYWSAEGVLYRGLMRERAGDLDGAVKIYQAYPAIPSRSAQRKIRGRIRFILRQQLHTEMGRLVKEESSRAKALPRLTVGVFPFRYVGVSSELAVLGRGLAEFLTTDLSMVRRLQVLERSRVVALLEEIGLGASGLVDDRTALRMGRIAGAGTVLNGVYRDFPGGVNIESAVADVVQGRLDNLRPVGGKLDAVFDMEKGIVFDAVSRLGIELTEIEREEISRRPTRNLLAFLEFSRGLAAEDAGDWPKAHTHYQAASKADPKFREAADKVQQLAETDRVADDVSQFEQEFLARSSHGRGDDGGGTGERWAGGGGEGTAPDDEGPGGADEEAGPGDEGAGVVDEGAREGEEEWPGANPTEEELASDLLDDLADVVTGGVDPGEDSREPSIGGEAGPPTIVIDIDFP
jgi:tetratricopeptide (TPR) repeat protein